MSVITGSPKPILFPCLTVSTLSYTINKDDVGIFNATVASNGTWTLPAMSTLKKGAFLWINNSTNFTITLNAAGSDTINGVASVILSPKTFNSLFTSTQWNLSSYAIPAITNSTTNTGYGAGALASISATGANNSAFGYQALNAITTGARSTAVGSQALLLCTGNDNTGVGYNSLAAVTTGTGNVALGSGSGATVATGTNNTAVGFSTSIGAAVSNSIALGNGAASTVSNNAVIGNGTVAAPVKLNATGPITYIGSQNSITSFAANGTATAANLSTGFIVGTGAGITVTLDTTANIINALFAGSAGTATAPLGSIFPVTFLNTAAGTLTLAAGDGSTTFSIIAPVIAAGTAANPTQRTVCVRLATSTTLVIT